MRGRRDARRGGGTAGTVPEVSMSDCTMYEPLLHLLLDGEISPAERADLEAHLAACPACRERLEQLEAVRGAFALLDAEVPAGLRERAMAAVRLEVRRERRRRLGRLARGLGALAACCVLAFLGLRLRGGTKGDSVLPGSADYSGGAYQDQALPPEEDGAPMLYMNGGGLADGAEPAAFPQYAEPEGSAGQEMEKDSLDGVEAPAGTRSIGEEIGRAHV